MKLEFSIWHCTSLYPNSLGGVEKHIFYLGECFKKKGVQVHVGLQPPDAKKNDQWIIHTHGDIFAPPALYDFLCQNPKTKWLQVCHGTSAGRMIACGDFLSPSVWRGVFKDRSLVRSAHGAVAVTGQALEEARTYFGFRGPGWVVGNGVDPGVFKPLSTFGQNEVRSSRVVYVGRGGDRVKNLERLEEAANRVKAVRPNFEMVWIPGPKQGPIFGKELATEMARSSALVLCSLYEGNPLVVHEARAMGMGLVLSDLPQLRGAFGDEYPTIWINPNSVASIEQGLKRVVDFKIEIEPRVRSWERVAKEFEGVYQDVLRLS